MSEDTGKEQLKLNEQEEQLIIHVREVKYGEMNIMIRNGKPVRIEEIKKSIMLKE